MSRIDDLLAELCPDGVEFKAIGQIGELVRGNGMPRSDLTDSGIGAIHYGQIYTYYGTWATETISYVPSEKATKLAKVDPGDLIVTNTSENVDDVCTAVAWLGNTQIVTGGHATVLKHSQDPKYLSYYFQTPEFFKAKKKYALGAKVIDVSAKSLAKIHIPVPPLDIQHEIVTVLDTFTELEAELEQELEAESDARLRQYAHYRESLFACSAETNWTPMGEVGQFNRGRRFNKEDLVAEGISCIHYGEIYTHYGVHADITLSCVRPELAPRLRFARPGDVVIASVGETVEDVCKAVAWVGDGEVAIHDECFAYRSSLDPKYVSYYFQTNAFHTEKAKHVSRAKVKRILGDGLAKIRIPVAPLEDQERIVSILDKFDALVIDQVIGLGAEIEARRRQYEHYRDKLLTFKPAA